MWGLSFIQKRDLNPFSVSDRGIQNILKSNDLICYPVINTIVCEMNTIYRSNVTH